jgi:hypothetical protein
MHSMRIIDMLNLVERKESFLNNGMHWTHVLWYAKTMKDLEKIFTQ